VRIGVAAAGGKNLEVLSPTIGRQLLELGLIDEIDLHIAPILLGKGSAYTTIPVVSRSASTGSPKATQVSGKRPVPTHYTGYNPPARR
jgi:riboflavin biosynthesis pyrimidine reductase